MSLILALATTGRSAALKAWDFLKPDVGALMVASSVGLTTGAAAYAAAHVAIAAGLSVNGALVTALAVAVFLLAVALIVLAAIMRATDPEEPDPALARDDYDIDFMGCDRPAIPTRDLVDAYRRAEGRAS